MSLNILNVAYPFASVSTNSVGGVEQTICALDAALVQAGHRSMVVAREDSQVQGKLFPVPQIHGLLDTRAREDAHSWHEATIIRVLATEQVDLIHLHGVDFWDYMPPPGVPTLVTLHLPLSWYPPEIFKLCRPETYLHCVSETQHHSRPPHAWLLPPIPNGVPVDTLTARHAKRPFGLALGRICQEKGFPHALEAAKRADMSLLLGGEMYAYAEHEQHFHNEIIPRLDNRRRFIGPLDFQRKRRLMSAAQCVIVPSLIDEASSLTAMEAMACGTPVIAYDKGALPEIIDHGRTGFLVHDVQEMAEAMRACADLDPQVCRQVAHERFDIRQTMSRYLELYEHLAQGEDVMHTLVA